MPFVKRDAPKLPPKVSSGPNENSASRIADLANPDADIRWQAARTLGADREGASALATALSAERVPNVRAAIMTALMRIGDETSVTALLPCLRSQDAALRGAAIEALQALPEAISPFLEPLLSDRDSDVRILATELARNMSAAEATRVLSGVLEREQHPNVCAAAIEVLTEVGTRDALPALQSCAQRFPGIPFMTFAVSTAVARITDLEG